MLSEVLSNITIKSLVRYLVVLGCTQEDIAALIKRANSKSVTLRFKSRETCYFLRKTQRDVDSATKHIAEFSHGPKAASKTVSTITEYFWKFGVEYEVAAFVGSGDVGSGDGDFQLHKNRVALNSKPS